MDVQEAQQLQIKCYDDVGHHSVGARSFFFGISLKGKLNFIHIML